MNLQEARKVLPELAGLNDQTALSVIHAQYYPDMDKADLASKLGVKLPEPKAPERSWAGVAKDVGITALKGAISVPEAAVGMADLFSGGQAGKALAEVGFRPGEAKQILSEFYSDKQKQAFRNVEQADGVMGTMAAALQNPSVIAHSIGESLPSMLAGGVIGRGMVAAAARMGAKTGAGMGTMAAAFGEGTIAAGSAAEQIRQQTADGLLTGEQAAAGAATGVATGVLGALGGKVAQKLGIADVDTMLVGAAQNPGVRKGVVRSALEGALSEGVLEELPQSISEQVLQNHALGKPLDEGVDQAAVLGLLSGTAMGAGANVMHSARGAMQQGDGLPSAEVPDAPARSIGQVAADKLRETQALPTGGPMTRAANAGVELAAQQVHQHVDAAAADGHQQAASLTGTSMAAMMQEQADTLQDATPVADQVEQTINMVPNQPAQAIDMVTQGVDPATGEEGSGYAATDVAQVPDVIGRRVGAREGLPYGAQSMAQKALDSRGLNDTHEVVPATSIDQKLSGFLIARKPAPADGPLIDEGTKPAAITPETGNDAQTAPVQAQAVTAESGAPVTQPATSGVPEEGAGGSQPPQAAPDPMPNDRYGVDHTPFSQGGKPFKTRRAADLAKKLQPAMRVVPVDGGFALADKTPAQLAAQAKAAKRLGVARTGTADTPISAHEFIAAEGGISKDAAADLGIEGNVRIGNRYLYAGQGKGLSLEQAAEKLHQAGYIKAQDHNEALDIVRTSLQRPQYTAEGWERLAQAEQEAKFEDFLAAQQDEPSDPFGPLTADELSETGYDEASEAVQAEIRALIEHANALGVDAESIVDDVVRKTQNASQQDYENAAKTALQSAIQGSDGRSGQDSGQAGAEEGRATTEPAAEGLTSYTADEIRRRQEVQAQADQARKQQEQHAERKAQADAEVDTFTLTGSDRAADVAAAHGQGGLFDAPAEQAKAETKADDTPASRWTRSTTAERIAIARAGGIALKPAENVAKKAWDNHDPVVQEKIAKGFKSDPALRPDTIESIARGAKKTQEREEAQRKEFEAGAGERASQREAIGEPTWQDFEGVQVLRVKDSPFVAVPHSGNRMSSKFDIVDTSKRDDIVAQLKGTEVRQWLINKASAEVQEAQADTQNEQVAEAAPAITREQLSSLYEYLRKQTDGDALRYSVLAKKFQRTADGTANDEAKKITLEWLQAMAEDGNAKQKEIAKGKQQAQEQAAEAERIQAEKEANSLSELKAGQAQNPNYKAFLDTLEQSELDEVTKSWQLNTRFMSFISQRKAEFVKDGGNAASPEELAKYVREYADKNLATRLRDAEKPKAQEPAPAKEAEPAKTASKTPKLDSHVETMKAVRDGAASPEQYKAGFVAVADNAEAIKAELNTQTKEALLRSGGLYFYQRHKQDTKPEIVDAVYGVMLEEYAIGKQYGPNSYVMSAGGLKRHQEARLQALRELVDGQTAETLAEHAAEVAASREEFKAKNEARKQAIENPQTLEDFNAAMRVKVGEGMTRQEAFLSLTPEQRTQYDELDAESTRKGREDRKRTMKTQVMAAGQTTGGEIVATKHTRSGEDLFVVKLAERVSREDYGTLLSSAKKLGGWYSSFRGSGAVPGFQFKEMAKAEAFLKLAAGDTTAAKEQVEQRRDAFEDDRSQSAAERLTEMAEALQERAEAALSQERKANTARRARFAASAEREANEQKALAQTMRNIAKAIQEGKAKFLDAVRQKVQIEFMRGAVRTAKDAELRAKYPSYADQEKRKGEPPTAETADFSEFPAFTAFRSDLASLARQLLEVDGTKKLGQQIMGVADDVTDAYLEFAKANLFKVSQFGVNGKSADFSSKADAEAAIRRSGLTGKAIVLAVKRGENRVILSPSEAINRQIWTGDGDKRITLSREFGMQLVEAIGRRGNKQNRLTVPWQFQNAADRLKMLARMGIETGPEYRSALREFIGLQERATEDKVRKMELAMVGRKADGLDFFPTPETVADQMIEAAEISPEMAVLEPSAGMGHIADRIREAGAEPEVIELSEDRRELLKEKGYYVQPYNDFMQMEPRKFFTFGDVMKAPDGTEGIMHGGPGWSGRASLHAINEDGTEGRMLGWYDRDELVGVRHRGYRGNDAGGYDRIVMNPPFSDRRDAQHVQHAYTLLKPGGRIVAIMGEGVFFGQDKKAEAFREWLDKVGGTSEKLPAGSFMDPSLPVNTGVNARMVVIDKPEGNAAGDSASFSRSPATQQAYEARIDALFAGEKAARKGAVLLDSSDIMGLLNHAKAPMVLNEKHLIDGLTNHPEMTAKQWKRVPGWLENPAAVYTDPKHPGRLTVIAPELVAGYPVVMAVEPNPESSPQGHKGPIQLLVTAFAKTTGDLPPIGVLASSGRLLYADTKMAPIAWKNIGDNPRAFNPSVGAKKILNEKYLSGYRRQQDPAMSRGQSFKGMSKEDAQKVVDEIRAKWANPPEVVVVESMDDPRVPQKAREDDAAARKSQKEVGAPEGFFYDGKVYIVAGALRTPGMVERVLYHESLGHFGLRGVFGDKLDPILRQLVAVRRNEIIEKARGYNLVRTDASGEPVVDVFTATNEQIWDAMDMGEKLTAAEEVLAEMAQSKPEIGFVKRVIALIRGFLRKYVPGFSRMQMTDEDIIANYILPARKFVERGPGGGPRGGVSFSRGAKGAMSENTSPQGANGGAMFSRSMGATELAGQVRDKLFDVKGATGNTLAHYRGMALQALGRRQLVDLYGDMLPQLKQYDELVQRMDAEKNDSAAEADAIANEWGKLDEKTIVGTAKNPGMERKLAELMHDATLAQMDPDKPLQNGDNPGQHAALKAKFAALSPNAQSVYRRARDMYEGHYAKVREAIQERIMRSELGASDKKAMIARMDADFFQKTKGVYFPLARFGKYVMVVKDAEGKTVNVSRAETLNEAETTRKMLLREFDKAKGFAVTKVMKEAEFNRNQDMVGKGFVADLFAVLDKQGVDDALRDSVSQLYLSSLPDLSWAKHGIHRKGTPGFSQDARRAFAQNVFHGARYLAKLRYSDQMQNEITAMGDHIKVYEGVDEYDGVKAQQVLDEMAKRHDNLMSPATNSVSTALTSVGYMWFMGLSPAAAMVNLSQTALVAYPVMGAKWGYDKAASALLLASKQTVQAKNDISKILTGDELDAYNRAVADGTIDVTMAHDLAGISQGEDAKVTWALRPVMKVASFMFHHAERFNRQATFIASYRLAKEAGAGLEAAFEQAKKATYDGHFDYSSSNRPRIMQGNVARVVFLFKQYGQNMIYTMSRQAYLATQSLNPKERAEARKQLGGMLALHAAAAGGLGLPLVGALLSAASFLGSDDDEPWDAEVALKNAMADAMGPKAAEVMAHGLSRLTPWDLSGRVALNKLILPDVQEGLEGQRWAESMSSAMLGPVWGIVTGMAKGVQEMGEGRYQRGLENMLPVALRNPVKALRYQEEGAIDKSGVAIKDEVSMSGVLGQAAGFSPSEVRASTEVKSAIYQHDKARMDRRKSLMSQFAQAQMAGDGEGMQEMREAIAKFNAKNPERRITPRQLIMSVRNRERRIEDAEKGVYLPKNRRDAIEAVRFGE